MLGKRFTNLATSLPRNLFKIRKLRHREAKQLSQIHYQVAELATWSTVRTEYLLTAIRYMIVEAQSVLRSSWGSLGERQGAQGLPLCPLSSFFILCSPRPRAGGSRPDWNQRAFVAQ